MSKKAIRTAIKNADKRVWTTDELNIWDEPGTKAEQLGELEPGKKVLVTGREMWGRSEIVLGGKSRWVTSGYFSDEEPPTLGGPCTNGTSVDSGVSSSIVAVHRAVCAAFPEISVYGALRGGGGDHGSGRAVDIMVSGARGWEVANFVRENYVGPGRLLRHLLPEHLVRRARRRGLARDVEPRLGHREPLRPRARLGLLIGS